MSRRWISILALVGMLLHAALAVRHHDMMTSMQIAAADRAGSILGELSPVQAAGVICQASTPKGHGHGHDGKSAPNCPCCITTADHATVLPDVTALVHLPSGRPNGQMIERDQRVDVMRKLRPPSRAPPVFFA